MGAVDEALQQIPGGALFKVDELLNLPFKASRFGIAETCGLIKLLQQGLRFFAVGVNRLMLQCGKLVMVPALGQMIAQLGKGVVGAKLRTNAVLRQFAQAGAQEVAGTIGMRDLHHLQAGRLGESRLGFAPAEGDGGVGNGEELFIFGACSFGTVGGLKTIKHRLDDVVLAGGGERSSLVLHAADAGIDQRNIERLDSTLGHVGVETVRHRRLGQGFVRRKAGVLVLDGGVERLDDLLFGFVHGE